MDGFTWQGLTDTMMSFFIDLINIVLDVGVELVDYVMLPVVDALPEMSYNMSFFYDVAALANQWLPLDYAIALVGAYYSFICGVCLIKWILGLIPFID